MAVAIRKVVKSVEGNFTFPNEVELHLFPGVVDAASSLGFILQKDGTAVFRNPSKTDAAVISLRTRNPLTRQETHEADIILGPEEEATQSARGQDVLLKLESVRPATDDEIHHKGTSGLADPIALFFQEWGWAIALGVIAIGAVAAFVLLSRKRPPAATVAGVPPPAPASPPVQMAPAPAVAVVTT